DCAGCWRSKISDLRFEMTKLCAALLAAALLCSLATTAEKKLPPKPVNLNTATAAELAERHAGGEGVAPRVRGTWRVVRPPKPSSAATLRGWLVSRRRLRTPRSERIWAPMPDSRCTCWRGEGWAASAPAA